MITWSLLPFAVCLNLSIVCKQEPIYGLLMHVILPTFLYIQCNPDITMYQGTGKITSLYRGIVDNESVV